MLDWDALLATAPPRRLDGTVVRLVESQEQIATHRLVATLARQAQLEALLERTKPPLRPGTDGLHYLLATPFRYPPLPNGSRFGCAASQGDAWQPVPAMPHARYDQSHRRSNHFPVARNY